MADDNRGWHGDSEGHAMAGSQSSGNQGRPAQHAMAGKKGGRARGKRQKAANQDDQMLRDLDYDVM